MNDQHDEQPNDPLDRGIAPVNGSQTHNTGKYWLMAVAVIAMLLVIYFFPGGTPTQVASDTTKNNRSSRSTDAQYTNPNGYTLGQPERVATKPVMPAFTPPKIPVIERRPDIKAVTTRPSSDELTPAQRRMGGGLSSRKTKLATNLRAPRFEDKPPELDSFEQQLEQLGAIARNTSQQAANTSTQSTEQNAQSLSAKLKTSKMAGAKASRIDSMSMTIARGRLFECVLDTAISSVVTGQVRCTVPHDVYGENGKLVMLDRGTEVVGEYKSDLRDGQARLGVIWTRAKTPSGVIIDLDSPATDTLGRGGVAGQVNTFFWKRFGAAIMLSILDDTLAAVVAGVRARNSQGGDQLYVNNSVRAGSDLAGIALERSINIRPVLIKNQGESVAVFLARDLSFKDVYAHRQLGVR